MAEKLALLGGPAAITLDQEPFTQWPISGDEEIEAVTEIIRNHKLSSSQPGGPIVTLEQAVADR